MGPDPPAFADLTEWRLKSGRPSDHALVFPNHDGEPWTEAAYQSWRAAPLTVPAKRAASATATPYALRH